MINNKDNHTRGATRGDNNGMGLATARTRLIVKNIKFVYKKKISSSSVAKWK